MSQRNRSPAHIHLPAIDAQHVRAVHRHAGKCLVDLNHIDVPVQIEVQLGHEFRDGQRRANAHDAGRDACDGGADELREDGQVEVLRAATFHEQDRRRAVGHLAAVAAGRSVAELWERWADLREGLGRRAPPRAFVLGQRDLLLLACFRVLDGRFEGDDFVVEPALALGALGALVAFGGVSILCVAGDVEVGADVLGGLAHRLRAVGRFLAGHDGGMEGGGAGTAFGHGFGANGDADIDATCGDLGGDVLDGFQAGRAEAVDGGGCGRVGEASGEGGGAGNVGGFGVVDLKRGALEFDWLWRERGAANLKMGTE